MNRKRQSQSAERANQQQSSFKLQSDQKQGLIVDPANEMDYIEDILSLMARINRTQFSDATSLKHSLKTQNTVYLNLLQLIANVIDPYFEIKSFSDEKFQLFLKRLGYPCKQISKTRFMSLGSSHTYLQSLHILSWLSRQAHLILTINERLEKGQYQGIEDESLSCAQKFKKLIAEYLQYGYTQQQQESQLEKYYRDAKQKLTIENVNIQKEINKLSCELNLVKTQEPNLQELEDQHNVLETELRTLITEISDCQLELEKSRANLNQTMSSQMEVDTEIGKLHKAIEIKRNQISSQPLSIEKAKELEAQDHQLTVQSQAMLVQLQNFQKNLERIRQEKTDTLCKLASSTHFLTAGGLKVGREYEMFEKTVLILEPQKGIQIGEDENLMDMDLGDLQFEQKVLHDKTNPSGKKQVYDYLITKDVEGILKFILPNKNELNEELDKQKNSVDQLLQVQQVATSELRMKLNGKQKQLEELDCGKKLVQQEIISLSDSTQELKVMKQIFLEHQDKHQSLLKEMESKKMEIKFLIERTSLECIEIDRLKQVIHVIQENIEQLQQQAETIEEKTVDMQQNFKEWVKDIINKFQQFVISNN